MRRPYYIFIMLLVLVSASCSRGCVPDEYESISASAPVFPDYTDVTVPSNIAPLNFMVRDADKVVAVFSWSGKSAVYGKGNKVQIPIRKWRAMMADARGGALTVTLFARTDGVWSRWNDFAINVSADPIDRYLSYRLIEPSYVSYEELVISQRDLESFEEKTFFSTDPWRRKGVDQCINCHSYQNSSTDNMVFHIRGQQGGTMLVRNGKAELLTDLKRDGMISNPVYPAWHPKDQIIAFSTNRTQQIFHTHDNAKVEVLDYESHLVLYDVENDRMIPVQADSLDMETFPAWSPDGSRLYYCSARYEQQNLNVTLERDMMTNYRDIHYSIYVRDYDRESRTLGPRRLVLDLPENSASLPRVSPDGRYLLFAYGEYGCFHIWHQDADIHMLDLETGLVNDMSLVNSSRADSYPSWSGNGRWVVLASRRDDGNYSRVYIAHCASDGTVSKAFELPQKDPSRYDRLLKSFNRPELTVNELPEIQ